MHHNVYIAPLPTGQLLAARRVLEGEQLRRGEAEQKLMVFYTLRMPEQVGEEISSGHLRGRPLGAPRPYTIFMAHEGELDLLPGEPAFRLSASVVGEVQAYFARTAE